MRTQRIWIPLMAIMLGLSMAAPTFAEPITCDPFAGQGGCLELGFFLNQDITQRITEVQVTDVESITGTYNAPDPFAAPLLSQQNDAQSLAFNFLGITGTPSGLQTSTEDIVPDFVMSSDNLNLSQDPNTVFIGDPEVQGPVMIQSALDRGLLTQNSSMVFPGNFFSDLGFTGVIVGKLNIILTRDETIVDAFRLNITQDTNGGGGGPGPGGNPIPEPSTMLLLGSGLAGLALWRWRGSRTP